MGELSGAEGNVTVTGNDSHLVVNTLLAIAESGVGYLRVQDKGQVNSAGTVLGFSTGGHGTGEVDGLDSLWQTGTMFVGNYGQGTVRITNGGKIDTTGNAYIGYTSNSHDSSVTLTGNAPNDTPATWQVSGNLYLAGNESGPSGAANSKLTISPGGLVDVAGTTELWGSGATLELLGGSLAPADCIKLTRPAHLTGPAAHWKSRRARCSWTARHPTASSATPSRSAPERRSGCLTPAARLNALRIGDVGAGTLTVSSGGRLECFHVTAGYASGSTGQFTVSGANAQVNVTQDLIVGRMGSAQGRVDVSAGGHVTANSIYLGRSAAASGIVTVDAADSTSTSTAVVAVGGFLPDYGVGGEPAGPAGPHVENEPRLT